MTRSVVKVLLAGVAVAVASGAAQRHWGVGGLVDTLPLAAMLGMVWPWRRGARVEIGQDGRGGSIAYREGDGVIPFSWEFGGGRAVALIFGPPADGWDAAYPWAAGRRAAVYDAVAAAAIRQRAPSCRAEIDLDGDTIVLVQ